MGYLPDQPCVLSAREKKNLFLLQEKKILDSRRKKKFSSEVEKFISAYKSR